MSNNIIISMWSGPRNLSTALMRSFGNRSDVTNVLDEPFYGSYLASTNKDHPMKKEVIQSLEKFMSLKPVELIETGYITINL